MLVACTKCERHVRASEPACPFCGAEVVPAARVVPPMPCDRALARAALAFLGAASPAACGKAPARDPDPATSREMSAPAYGPPPEPLVEVPEAGAPDARKK